MGGAAVSDYIFTHFTALVELNLSQNVCKVPILERPSRLTQLRKLVMNGCDISDEGFLYLV
jgi:hypothetical protein